MKKIAIALVFISLVTGLTAADKRTETLRYGWDGSNWVQSGKTTYTYPNDHTSIMTNYGWSGGDWLAVNRITTTLNNNGEAIEILTEIHNQTGSWIQLMHLTLVYTYNNGKITEIQTTTNSSILTRNVYTYTNDKLTKILNQMWTGSAWLDSERHLFTYDGNNLTATITEQTTDAGATWTKYMKTQYTYSGGRKFTIETLNWDTGAWVKDNIRYLSYNGNGTISEEHGLHWLSTKYVEGTMWYHTYGGQTEVVENNHSPRNFNLANYPNPFNPETKICFTIQKNETVSLKVYNTRGALVRTLIDGRAQLAGSHTIIWNGCGENNLMLPSGVYFYKLNTSSQSRTQRCLLLK